MLSYLKKSYGTDPSNTVHLINSSSTPLTESYIKSKLVGKKGIYVIVANNPSKSTGFGATGHVDVLNSDGSFVNQPYWYCKGGVKEVYLFILN